MKKLSLVILLLSICFLSQGQDYYFRNYQVNDGISSNTITCITQDKKGFIWFGTRNGLNRFDGNHFKIFKNNINDSLSIGDNSILSLYEDKEQRLWIGTYKGVYLYDAVYETFTLLKKIPRQEVRTIEGDNSGNVWLLVNNVLYKYCIQTDTFTPYTTPNTPTLALSITTRGKVWSATGSGLVQKYDSTKSKFIDYDILPLYKGKGLFVIQTIYPVDDTLLLISTLQQTFLFNTRSNKLINVFEGTSLADNIQVHKIIRQSGSEYWLGTENGLCILNLQTRATKLIQKQYANPYALDDNVINSLYKDAEGSVWVGTFFGGLNFYSSQLNKFQKYFPIAGTNSLSGNLVHEITEDKYNNLWVGTEDAGLNKMDSKTGLIKHFEPDKKRGSISYQNIHGLLADDDKLWIGTYEHGLDVLDLKTEKVIRHYEKSNNPNSLNGNFIVTIYRTREGNILIGTWGGLFQYNKLADNFELMPYFKRQAQAIHEDAEGTLWVCSYGNGVYYYNPLTGKKGSFQFDADDINSLVSNYVNNLYEDSRKNIWFCTEGGLCKYDFISKKIERYTHLEGLKDNQIFKVMEDAAGNLWVSTSKGLVELNTKTNTTLTYNTFNGLLSDQFNYNSGFKKEDGTFYFGTVKGMIRFNPLNFNTTTFIPPVYITDLQIDNKEFSLHNDSSLIRQSILYATKITLPYNSSTISLDVAALSYITPGLNEYNYRMDGLDKEWIHISSNRKIYYTKIPPGNYTFRIKGTGNSNIWNNKETTLRITVLPPLWATWWAYLLYALAGAGILLVVLRYYSLALKEKNRRKIEALEREKEREIYNAKIEFFTNIAHEIRTPLTLIKMPLDKLRKKEFVSTEIKENLNMMNNNTNRLIDLTNQLLDFRKAESNKFSLNFTRHDISDLLREIYASFKPAAEQKNLNFRLELPRVGLQAYVDIEALRKIITNLFNNAIKYSEKSVFVKLLPFSSEDTIFTIEVRNDGNLIPYRLKEKVFEPFYRMKETEKEPGTGIGLALSRSLAELHNGVIDLNQPEGNMNVFVLSLPIHQEKEIKMEEYDIVSTEQSSDTNIGREQYNAAKPFILLVEDNKEIIDFVQKELKEEYNILKAYNGQQALEILLKENVQLVVSDIMMPVMDGIELVKKIKSDLQYSHIPIILLTAKNTLDSRIQGLEVGADAYIEKPFSLDHLQAQIKNLLNNRRKIKDFFAKSPLTQIRGIAYTKPDKDFIEHIHQTIYENVTNFELDVDQLSKLMNMSKPTLYRKINALSDLSPNELINLTRLKKASELLAEGAYKVSEVAHMVGYTLATNFSRDFHKQFGISPSQYLGDLREENP